MFGVQPSRLHNCTRMRPPPEEPLPEANGTLLDSVQKSLEASRYLASRFAGSNSMCRSASFLAVFLTAAHTHSPSGISVLSRSKKMALMDSKERFTRSSAPDTAHTGESRATACLPSQGQRPRISSPRTVSVVDKDGESGSTPYPPHAATQRRIVSLPFSPGMSAKGI